jgi:hypothetical protein
MLTSDGSYVSWGSTFPAPCEWRCTVCEYAQETERASACNESEAAASHPSRTASDALGASAVDNSAKIAACGGIARILDALVRHKDSAAVVTQACGAIKNLASSRAASDNRSQIVAEGGIPRLVNVMRLHKNKLQILEVGVVALQAIGKDKPEHYDMMRDSGAVDVIQAAMRHSETTKPTKFAGVDLLSHLVIGYEIVH